jgi:hypothetical protein
VIQVEEAAENDKKDEKQWDEGLKPRERLFCLYYCTDEGTIFNGKQAYRKAYMKRGKAETPDTYPEDATCEVNACKLLRKTKVKTALRELLALTQADANEKNVYRSLHDIALLGFYNPADIVKEDGSLKCSFSEMGELTKCIEGIETMATKNGGMIRNIKLAPRGKYLQLMSRILNLIQPKEIRLTADKLPVILLQGKTGEGLKDADKAIEEWNKENATSPPPADEEADTDSREEDE